MEYVSVLMYLTAGASEGFALENQRPQSAIVPPRQHGKELAGLLGTGFPSSSRTGMLERDSSSEAVAIGQGVMALACQRGD